MDKKIIKVDLMVMPSSDQRWEPLEQLIGSKNCGNRFYFIGAVTLVDDTVIYAYKNIFLRYYLNLSEDGRLWLYDVGEGGYYEFDIDRDHIRTVINLGGDPFVKLRDGNNSKTAGYLFNGRCYCADCIKNQASVGGKIIIVPLYGDETALTKKCIICKEDIRGGLRNESESTEAVGTKDHIHEIADYKLKFV